MLKNCKIKSIFTLYLIALLVSIAIALHDNFIRNNYSASKNEDASHLLEINILLHSLRTQCANEDLDRAQNTFLDLMQQWQYQDVIMLNKKHKYYFPSDSLARLDSLLNQLQKNRESQPTIRMVLKEIKLINQKVDAIK